MILPKQTRAIGTSRRALTGYVNVKGAQVPFESSLERDFLISCDFESSILGVVAQPHKINYVDSNRKSRHYTPDFFVRHADGQGFAYEIKYSDELNDNWQSLKERFRAARVFYRDYNAVFKILTERKIRVEPRWGNISFLRQYQSLTPHEDIEQHLLKTLTVLGETTPQALLEFAYHSPQNKMKALGYLWRLIVQKQVDYLSCDNLTMHTPIWLPNR